MKIGTARSAAISIRVVGWFMMNSMLNDGAAMTEAERTDLPGFDFG
jgi:hypothetical protein